MSEQGIPVLQKPPGYRNPNAPTNAKPVVPKIPVRKPVLPQSYHHKKKKRSCKRICCCFFCILLFLLIVVGLVIFGLFFLWFEPKLPFFHLQSLKVDRFNITVKSDGGTYLDSEMTVKIEAKNPNGKIKFIYGLTEMSLTSKEGTGLGSASLAGFTQCTKNTTRLKFKTRLKNGLVDDGLGAKLKASYRNKELIVMSEIRTKVRFGLERWTVWSVWVNVICGDLSLKKLDGGAMPKCTINLLKWINIH